MLHLLGLVTVATTSFDGLGKFAPGSIAVGTFQTHVVAVTPGPGGYVLNIANGSGCNPLTRDSVRWACADEWAVWAVFSTGAVGWYAKGRWSFVSVWDEEYPNMSCNGPSLALFGSHIPAKIISVSGQTYAPGVNSNKMRVDRTGSRFLFVDDKGSLALAGIGLAKRDFGKYRDFGWMDGNRFFALSSASLEIWSTNGNVPILRRSIPSRWRSSVYYSSFYDEKTRSLFLVFNPSGKTFRGRAGVLKFSGNNRFEEKLIGIPNTSVCVSGGKPVALGFDGRIRSVR